MKHSIFFKYFSLASFLLNTALYLIPVHETGFYSEYLLIINFSAMIACLSMMTDLRDRDKRHHFTFNLFKLLGIIKSDLIRFSKVVQRKPLLCMLVFCSIVLVMMYGESLTHTISEKIDQNLSINSVAAFMDITADFWIISSFIPTIYFFCVIPLIKSWNEIGDC